MKRMIIIVIMILSYTIVHAQNSITGKISDEHGLPLHGATVIITELARGNIADQNGYYTLHNLPNGKIKIQYSFIGYANEIKTIVLTGKDSTINITLNLTAIEAEEIVVTGGFSAAQHENSVKIDVLKLKRIENKISPNFAEILTQVPGVDMISKGSGVSKPVIRGLSMNDILVLNHGVRFENYQYSDHHPLGIDEFGIDAIEVIKGPASLLYGSDAIGGVINFLKEKPASPYSIVGDYNLQMFSNSQGITNNFGIKGATNKLFAGIRAGQKTNADYLQGGGNYVPNSRFNEYSIKSNAGYSAKEGVFRLFYDHNRQNLGLASHEAIENINERGRNSTIFYQQLSTNLLSSQNKVFFGRMKLDANASWQHTELIHYGEADFYEIQMNLSTLTYETKLYLPSDAKSEYIVGFQGINQKNTNINDREVILLPNAYSQNYSGYALVQHTFFNHLKIQAGLRYDHKTIDTKAIGDISDISLYRPQLYKRYGSLSGSVGATYSFTEQFLIRANFASAYRTPNLAELTSNGQHEARYEIGHPRLDPQNAYETDLSLHIHKDNYTIDVAGFYNQINNYIFIAPTGDTTNTGINVYRYMQSNSVLFGGEAGLHIHPAFAGWLHFQTTFSAVVGEQENGDYLPFVPAHKLNLDLKIEKEKLSVFTDVFASLSLHIAFDQNHPAPDETNTSGYTLLDGGIGGNIKAGNQFISIAFSVNNIFDKKYVDHLSTLKDVGFYNPGRNYTLSLRIPFAIVVKPVS